MTTITLTITNTVHNNQSCKLEFGAILLVNHSLVIVTSSDFYHPLDCRKNQFPKLSQLMNSNEVECISVYTKFSYRCTVLRVPLTIPTPTPLEKGNRTFPNLYIFTVLSQSDV